MSEDAPAWPSLGCLLREQAKRFGERELFRFEGASATYGDVEERTNRLANVLVAHGIGKGDRVAVMLPNGIEFPVAWLAIAKTGAVMVPVNVRYREQDLTYVLNDSGVTFAVAGREQAEILTRVRSRCPQLREIGVLRGAPAGLDGSVDLQEELTSASTTYDISGVRPNDLLNIQYTSGTTGFPKGCMLTHGYWLSTGQIMAEQLGAKAGDVDLTAQSFHYMDPQWNAALCMVSGATLVILPRFSASTLWQSVKENEVTFFYVLATMPIYLLKQPEDPQVDKTHSVRLVLCSGLAPRLHAACEARWGVPWRETYGTTETGADLVVPIEDVSSVGSGAIGRPVRTKEAKVVDEEGNELPDGEPGELVVRGEPMMLGYWNKPEETAKTIRDGWLHTGDLAFRDEKGYYHLVGRKKDMIRRSGENIAAAEVEGVLSEHPNVRAAAVVSVPDELRGEEVKAFVQLQPGLSQEAVDPRDFVEHVKGKLATFKAPRFVEFVDDFPMTPSERVAKHELLRMKEDQQVGTYDAVEERWR